MASLTIQQSIDMARKDPNSDFAKLIRKQIESGRMDNAAQIQGVDLTQFGRSKQTEKREDKKQNFLERGRVDKETGVTGDKEKFNQTSEKIADFTGGKEISQGLGQALTQRSSSKMIEEQQATQFDLQGRLIERIKSNKAEGKDTSRLEGALQDLTEDTLQFGEDAEQVLNPNELTNKQVVGDALQLGTSFASGKVAGAVAGKATQAVGIGKGIVQGAKTGALTGTALGGVGGVSQGLQDDLSGGEIIKKGVGGAVGGAITGGILGGAVGGVSGGIKGAEVKKAQELDDFLDDLVSPKVTTKVKEQAFLEGRVTEQGLLQGSKITASARDKQLASAVKDVVSVKNSPAQNLNAIKSEVGNLDTGLKAYVKINKVPFNKAQLKSQLNAGKSDLKLIFASDATAEKTYNAIVKEFMRNVDAGDTAGLFKARQSFDKIPAIKKLLDSQGLGENAKREIALAVRGQANSYVASLLPKGNTFRATLLKEHHLLEAMTNLAGKGSQGLDKSGLGKSKLVELINEYPILKWVVGSGIGGGFIGGAIIKSTD